MKKLISLLLTVFMLASTAALTANAGQVFVDADFSNMDAFEEHFHAGLYYADGDGTIFGYSEAMCLQTKGEWIEYDTVIDVAFDVDDMATGERAYSVWYCNINPETYGLYDGGTYTFFGYNIDKQECYLNGVDMATGEEVSLMENVPLELEDGETYTFGMSVTKQRVRCFINDELIFDYYDANNTYLIGMQDENTEPTCIVYWNHNNFVRITDVKIASAEHFFPLPDDAPVVTDNGGDIADDTTTKAPDADASEATTKIVEEIVTNDKGETSVVTKIVTEATTTPGAETNVHNGGGSSTSTGDSAFVVVAAMIATLGCAVVVKKSGVR